MKKIFFLTACFNCFTLCSMAQAATYVRFTAYSNLVLTTGGSFESAVAIKDISIDPANGQFFKISAYSGNVFQTLNIGSQSTGAGAGRVTFNPFSISKKLDAASPVLFQAAASGTPYKTVEVFFTNAKNVVMSKHTYKLVAVKTVAWTTCEKECEATNEMVSFEYGGQVITVYKTSADGKPGMIQNGWNRIKNVADNDPTVVIQ